MTDLSLCTSSCPPTLLWSIQRLWSLWRSRRRPGGAWCKCREESTNNNSVTCWTSGLVHTAELPISVQPFVPRSLCMPSGSCHSPLPLKGFSSPSALPPPSARPSRGIPPRSARRTRKDPSRRHTMCRRGWSSGNWPRHAHGDQSQAMVKDQSRAQSPGVAWNQRSVWCGGLSLPKDDSIQSKGSKGFWTPVQFKGLDLEKP